MEKELIEEIINSLKKLIKELKNGYCDNLTSDQLIELQNGFEHILKVEKEVEYGFNAARNPRRFISWSNILHHVFPFKKEGDKHKDRK